MSCFLQSQVTYFLNRCRTCMIKENQEKEDLVNITKYCVLGKSYKDVLLTLAPNTDETFLNDDNCVCENCAETLSRSALLIHNFLMIEKKLKTISSQLKNNKPIDITEKKYIEENKISISRNVITDNKNTENCITHPHENLNKATCVLVDLTTAENINRESQNDYTKKDFQHDSKEKSADSSSLISPNLSNLLDPYSLLDGVKKHDKVISLNPSDRPVLENQLSRLMEHGINIFDVSRNSEEDGKDVKRRVILIGLDQHTKYQTDSKSIEYSEPHNCHKIVKPKVPKRVQKRNLCDKVVKTSLTDMHVQKHVRKAQNAQKPTKEKRTRVRKDYTCQTCSEKFTSKEEFQFHLKIHPPFVCGICSKGFVKRCSLKSHMVTHNDQNSYICDVCGKGYKNKNALRVHLKTHRDDKTYSCTQCMKVLKNQIGVVRHMKIVHEKSLQSQCPECGKVFATKGYLKSHVKVVHLKEKPYKCHICQQMFGRIDHMRNHIARHTTHRAPDRGRRRRKIRHVLQKDKGKPAPCKFCGMLFADMIKLERHLQTHFNRYQCRFCRLTFARKSLCIRHEKVLHEGVTSDSFRCNVCWKRLVSKEALDEHVKRHNKPRYTCDQCGKKFNRRFEMNHHILVDHSNMPDRDEMDEIIYNSLVEASSSVTDIKPEDLLS